MTTIPRSPSPRTAGIPTSPIINNSPTSGSSHPTTTGLISISNIEMNLHFQPVPPPTIMAVTNTHPMLIRSKTGNLHPHPHPKTLQIWPLA
ncbi:hypothetical protein PIB30_014646 [Stylosanthes scabra]|uniref:Uncharacterized protein n=1 Tax=Stylosanthes scabra TaxID=79078 RepID=A0ABU6S6N9_9FABA|nr:hypothetical protein [Stylosanthes scabra]